MREVSADAKVSFTAGYSWIDSFSFGTFGTLNDIQPSCGLPAASAALNDKGYFLRVAGKNLTDKAYRTQSLPPVFFQGRVLPRRMASAGVSFACERRHIDAGKESASHSAHILQKRASAVPALSGGA